MTYSFPPRPSSVRLVAIDGAAARLGRDRARQGDVAANRLVGANRERGDGAVYRRVADPAAAVQPFAQANDAGKGVDDDKFTILRPRDQQPAIIGAAVDRALTLRSRERGGAGRMHARGSVRRPRPWPRRAPCWRCNLPPRSLALSSTPPPR